MRSEDLFGLDRGRHSQRELHQHHLLTLMAEAHEAVARFVEEEKSSIQSRQLVLLKEIPLETLVVSRITVSVNSILEVETVVSQVVVVPRHAMCLSLL